MSGDSELQLERCQYSTHLERPLAPSEILHACKLAFASAALP